MPGGSTPRHLPPSGFEYPLDGFLSSGPGTWSVDQGSAHGVRPSGPCSSRPAVPFSGPRLSCRFSASAFAGAGATPEVNSDREGERKPLSENSDRRTLPSWVFGPFRAFSSAALGPASRSEPLLPFRPEVLPTFHFRAGLQGIVSNGSGLPLSRLPALLGFRTFPYTRASLGSLRPWLMVSPRPEGLFGASDDPTGVQRADASVHSIHLTPDSDCFSMSNVRVPLRRP